MTTIWLQILMGIINWLYFTSCPLLIIDYLQIHPSLRHFQSYRLLKSFNATLHCCWRLPGSYQYLQVWSICKILKMVHKLWMEQGNLETRLQNRNVSRMFHCLKIYHSWKLHIFPQLRRHLRWLLLSFWASECVQNQNNQLPKDCSLFQNQDQ